MIVPSMTVQEIYKEIFEDIETLDTKIDACRRDFKKLVLRSTRYPVEKTYEAKTRVKKNTFVFTLIAPKRSAWSDPDIVIYAIYMRPEGKYAVPIIMRDKSITIYPPHYFKRYRE